MKQFNMESENLSNQDKLTVVQGYLEMSEGSAQEINSGTLDFYSRFVPRIRDALFATDHKDELYLSDIDKVISSEFTESQDEIIPVTDVFDKKLALTKKAASEIKSKFDNDKSLPLKIKIDFIYSLATNLQHGEGIQFFSEATIDSFLYETFGYEVAELKIPAKNQVIHQVDQYIQENKQQDSSVEDLIKQLIEDGYEHHAAKLIAEDLVANQSIIDDEMMALSLVGEL